MPSRLKLCCCQFPDQKNLARLIEVSNFTIEIVSKKDKSVKSYTKDKENNLVQEYQLTG